MNNKLLSRRQFVTGVTMGATALAINPSILFAGVGNKSGLNTLKGNIFNLNIGEQSVNFTGTQQKPLKTILKIARKPLKPLKI